MKKVRRVKANNKLRKIALFGMVAVFGFISLGYAAFSSNLKLFGTLFVSPKPIIRSFVKYSKEAYHADEYSTKITTINLSDTISAPGGVVKSWNLGVNGNGNVRGYLTSNDGNATYTLHIQGDGSLIANPDSTYLFGVLTNLETINNLNILDTSKVISAPLMFYGCEKLASLDLSNFDTSNISNMQSMFENCASLTSLDVSNFDTSKVVDMRWIFCKCSSLESLDLSNFDTRSAVYMEGLFHTCSGLTSLNLSNFDTSNVVSMYRMFYNCTALMSLVVNFDTINVTNMRCMFQECSSLQSLDVRMFDTSNVSNMQSMFENCASLTSLDVSNFDTSNVADMRWIFCKCSSLESLDLSNFDTRSATYMEGLFHTCSSLTSLNLSNFDTSNVTNMRYMFYNCSNLQSLDLSNFNTNKVSDMSFMFSGFLKDTENIPMKLTSIKFGDSWNTSSVTDMSAMFQLCSDLTSLDLSKFNTSSVKYMQNIFYNCSNLQSLDVSNFNTSNVENMSYMFYGCANLLGLNLGNFNTSKVTTMRTMFMGCSKITSLDLSSFNTSSLTNIQSMFEKCFSLTSLDLSSFDTSKVTDMRWVFSDCSEMTSIDLSKFDTSSATTMQGIFLRCSSLESLNLNSFNTSKVENMESMFSNCASLTKIYVGSAWSVTKVTSSTNMFTGCTKLVGAVAYDSTKTDATMANYTTGYLRLSVFTNFVTHLKSLATSDTVLLDDGTANHNMRYMGKSPNNYVIFEGEEWRVIGVFNDIDNGNGTKESRVKIIKSEPSKMAWDSNGSNVWKNASLNTELQASTYGTSSLVDNAVWYLGDPGGEYTYTTAQAYTFERGTTVASGNDPTWTGKVGLMYPSDYGFASSACKDSVQLMYYSKSDPDCVGTNWLLGTSTERLFSPVFDKTDETRVVAYSSNYSPGFVYHYTVSGTPATRPVVYLKSSVTCMNCDNSTAGTKEDPFQLA